jgi:hypothetical protein
LAHHEFVIVDTGIIDSSKCPCETSSKDEPDSDSFSMGELMISDGLKCVSQSVSVIKKSPFARFSLVLFDKGTLNADASGDSLIQR